MSKDYIKQLNEMKRLINYGTESQKNKKTCNELKGILQYSELAANGKTYGIVKEGANYFIKVAPKKHTAVLLEDFEDVNGRANRRLFESYPNAVKELNNIIINVNKCSSSKNKPKSTPLHPINESSEWITAKTKEMRRELERFNQINEYVNKQLDEKLTLPYTELAKADYNNVNGGGNDGEMGKEQKVGLDVNKYLKKVDKDVKGASAEDYRNAEGEFKLSTKHETGKPKDIQTKTPYTEKAPNTIIITEEQYNKLTKIYEAMGLAVPDSVTVGGVYGNDDIEDSAEGIVNQDLEKDPSVINRHLKKYGENPDSLGIDFDDSLLADLPDDNDALFEELDKMDECGDDEDYIDTDAMDLYEQILNVFGKHPSFMKEPLTTDKPKECKKKPCKNSKKIEASFPFEDMVDMVYETVMNRLKKKL